MLYIMGGTFFIMRYVLIVFYTVNGFIIWGAYFIIYGGQSAKLGAFFL